MVGLRLGEGKVERTRAVSGGILKGGCISECHLEGGGD